MKVSYKIYRSHLPSYCSFLWKEKKNDYRTRGWIVGRWRGERGIKEGGRQSLRVGLGFEGEPNNQAEEGRIARSSSTRNEFCSAEHLVVPIRRALRRCRVEHASTLPRARLFSVEKHTSREVIVGGYRKN